MQVLIASKRPGFKTHISNNLLMPTFLFDKIVFGPVHSRRLGVSLGINLLPTSKKYCNFNCIYCECGLSNIHRIYEKDLPSRQQTRDALLQKLEEMKQDGKVPEVITFAGNGEPTLHPDFSGIIDDSIALRNAYFPDTPIAVLTNSTRIFKKEIIAALSKTDQCILKLDTMNPETFNTINCPSAALDLDIILRNLIDFPGKKIIQTLFLRGNINGIQIDNTSAEELNGLIEAYKEIKPEKVIIYTFDRDTPYSNLQKIPSCELEALAHKIRAAGITTDY